MTVHVPLPDEFLKYFSQEELERKNRLVLAIELYLEEKISIGKAANLSGLKFDEFESEIKKRGIKKLVGPENITKVESEMEILKELSKTID